MSFFVLAIVLSVLRSIYGFLLPLRYMQTFLVRFANHLYLRFSNIENTMYGKRKINYQYYNATILNTNCKKGLEN